MSVIPWARGRGRRRADASELARASWADAVACAQRNYAARLEWERTCRQAVRDSGPARPRPARPEPVCVVVVVVADTARAVRRP